MGIQRLKEKYTLDPSFELRECGGEFIAVKRGEELADPSRVVFMNERMVWLWSLLRDEKTVREMVGAFMSRYGVEEEEAMDDVGEFLGKLKCAKII